MTLTQLKIDIESLTTADKAAIIEFLLASLNNGSLGIKKTPGVCGGDACVGNSRIPVWSLVNYRRLGASDGVILESFPHLTAADLVNVWAYADAYPEEIEQAIRENDEVMEESEVYWELASLYSDENFSLAVVKFLRALGHDVLTVQEAGKANLGIPDEEVLAFAVRLDRAVLTGNRRDYIKLHRSQPNHSGIIVCTEDLNFERLASRIDEAISGIETLRGELIRVNRPLKWERAISTLLEPIQLNDEYS